MSRSTSKAKPAAVSATGDESRPQPLSRASRSAEGLSIAGVARQAGVSVATVSRVLNAHENVRPATRDKVLAAVDASGYRVNELARNL
ncbi:LacI family DNA-binding transcriptional regulator, partial [Paraburkholderia caledonica]